MLKSEEQNGRLSPHSRSVIHTHGGTHNLFSASIRYALILACKCSRMVTAEAAANSLRSSLRNCVRRASGCVCARHPLLLCRMSTCVCEHELLRSQEQSIRNNNNDNNDNNNNHKGSYDSAKKHKYIYVYKNINKCYAVAPCMHYFCLFLGSFRFQQTINTLFVLAASYHSALLVTGGSFCAQRFIYICEY